MSVLIRQLMPGHGHNPIPERLMSTEAATLNYMFNLHYHGPSGVSASNFYPRRAVGYSSLPEKTTYCGTTLSIRHCVFNFGDNLLSFDFSMTPAKHDAFPDMDRAIQARMLTRAFISMLRLHGGKSSHNSIDEDIARIKSKGVFICYDGYDMSPRRVRDDYTLEYRTYYRAHFHLSSDFEVLKPEVSKFEI